MFADIRDDIALMVRGSSSGMPRKTGIMTIEQGGVKFT